MERTAPHSQGNRQQSYQPLLQGCRDMALAHLDGLLDSMFGKAEQALLDFIDQADTNQGQFQFIDAISVTKTLQETVSHCFREQISRGFTEFSRNQPISYPTPLLESQQQATQGLELVGDSELDQRLSLQNMIDKAKSGNFQQLYGLEQRLAMVRGGEKLEEQDIPAGPVHIASSFHIAADEFGFDSNIRLIIYALFAKFVMHELNGFYSEYNERLIEAGIFPNLKLEVPTHASSSSSTATAEPATVEQSEMDESAASRRYPSGYPAFEQPLPPQQMPGSGPQSGSADTAAATQAGGDAPMMPLGEELFESIRSLMASRRSQDTRFAQHPDYNPAAANTRQMVDAPVLVSALDTIQPVDSTSYLPEASAAGDHPASINIDSEMLDQVRTRLIDERERLFQGVDPNTIPSADLDTIELVGMLFEHVLNEESLPNIAKALISHLHTPYLKVAILDHHFLIDSQHIARKLLNRMVDAGRLWIEENDLRRGIYYPMREQIDRILAEFKDDLAIFENAFEVLSTQIQELEQKAKVVEARAHEAAKGRERLEGTRLRAKRIVADHIGDRPLHPAMDRFLNHAWLDKMILMLLRDSEIESSQEWQRVIHVIDEIVWFYDHREGNSHQDARYTRLPGLKQRIEEGFVAMGDVHQPDLLALFKLLQGYIDGDSQGEQTTAVPTQPRRTAAVEPTGKTKSRRPLSDDERAMVKQLKKVTFGTWFEIEDDNKKIHRLKLSWFSPVTQKYMFVDKSGIQALVTPVDLLARQICNGRAKILKQPRLPFVDRALETVLGALKKGLGG